MPIALGKASSGIGGPGFGRPIAPTKCCHSYELSGAAAAEGKEDSCSSSSIGRDSSSHGSGGGRGSDGEEETDLEVQSRLEAPLGTMDALEGSLPMRRGISKFYSGKSKSFSSLSDAFALPSAKDLAKQENAYTRKRKNLLAFSIVSGKFSRKEPTAIEGGISKKPSSSCCSSSVPSFTKGSSVSSMGNQNPHERARLPPRHPQGKSCTTNPDASNQVISAPHEMFSVPVRSFSLTDLHRVVDSSSFSRRNFYQNPCFWWPTSSFPRGTSCGCPMRSATI